jgi:hypothetical protein
MSQLSAKWKNSSRGMCPHESQARLLQKEEAKDVRVSNDSHDHWGYRSSGA